MDILLSKRKTRTEALLLRQHLQDHLRRLAWQPRGPSTASRSAGLPTVGMSCAPICRTMSDVARIAGRSAAVASM